MERHPLVPVIRFWLLIAGLLLLSLVWPELAMFAVGLAASNSCCCPTCTIYSDDFTTDRTGTDYSVRSGSWAVSGGKITCTSASALIRAETAAGGGATACYISADVTPASTSDIGGVAGAIVDDNTLWKAVVQPGAANGTLKLYQRSGGVDTQRGSTATLTGYTSGMKTVCLSFAYGQVTVSVGSTAISYTASVTVASTKAGLVTGAGSSSVAFDNLAFNKHRKDDSTCSECTMSCSQCQNSAATETVQIDVSGFTGDCTGLGGVNCNDFNGSFILTPDASVPCQYLVHLGVANLVPCSLGVWYGFRWNAGHTSSAWLGDNIGSAGQSNEWSWTNSDPQDCTQVQASQASTNGFTHCFVTSDKYMEVTPL
jgi:hypothetical protein